MANPAVTVAMSVYNAADTMEFALRSIINQTFEDWELVVVDDGSTDNTKDILLKTKDPRIRFIHMPSENKGLAPRLNQCVQLARGRYVARMDADDVAFPRRLEQQVRFLEENSGIDLLGTGAIVFKGEGEVIGCYPTSCNHEDICRRPWWGFPLAHPTWMAKKTWFMSNPYCEGHLRCEDQELLLRSFSHSRFAALKDVLLGYRLQRISTRKMGQGRINYCRQLLRQIHDAPSAMNAVRGLLIHSLALGRDIFLDVSGVVNQQSRRSFESANEQLRAEWKMIWDRVTSR